MKVLLLTGILIVCFLRATLSQNENQIDQCNRNITSIDENTDFLKNASLDIQIIDLCKNDLLTIDRKSFQRFEELTKLNLEHNSRLKFNSDGSGFLESKSLTDLQCFRCGVDKIYNKSLQGMPKLEQINLTNNIIEEIEVAAFYAAKNNLENIDLRSNQLKWVPREMLTPLVKIRIIELSFNRELAPEGSEPFLISTALKTLRCNECGFVTISENTFSQLLGLKELSLKRNKISQIHSMAFPQLTLTKLMLEGNALNSIDTSILHVVNRTICLANNTIELECFLKDLSYQQSESCSNVLREDVECLAPTTTEIYSTNTIDITNSTTDATIIPANVRMPLKTPDHTNSFGKTETVTTSNPSTPASEKFEGISDAYIGGYLTFIVLVQIVTFVLLVGIWLKLKKYDTNPDVDRYAASILNPSPIYIAIY